MLLWAPLRQKPAGRHRPNRRRCRAEGSERARSVFGVGTIALYNAGVSRSRSRRLSPRPRRYDLSARYLVTGRAIGGAHTHSPSRVETSRSRRAVVFCGAHAPVHVGETARGHNTISPDPFCTPSACGEVPFYGFTVFVFVLPALSLSLSHSGPRFRSANPTRERTRLPPGGKCENVSLRAKSERPARANRVTGVGGGVGANRKTETASDERTAREVGGARGGERKHRTGLRERATEPRRPPRSRAQRAPSDSARCVRR